MIIGDRAVGEAIISVDSSPFFDRLSSPLPIIRAAAAQWVGALLSGAISVGLTVWLARVMAPSEFATFGTALNAALIALVLMDGGWSTLLYRELAGGSVAPCAKQMPAAALAHVVLAVGPCVLVLVLVLPSSSVALSAAMCMFAVALMNQYSARLRAAGAFAREALWQLSGRACSAAAIVAVVAMFAGASPFQARPATQVFLAWTAGLAFCLLLSASRWWCLPNWQAIRSTYPLTLSMLMTELSVTLIGKGDLVLLSLANSIDTAKSTPQNADALVGYAASIRLVEGVLLLVAPLANVVISYLRESTPDRRAPALQNTLGCALALWLLGCVLWASGCAAGSVIFRVVFGIAYEGNAWWLVWASLPLPWMMANLVLLQVAVACADLHLVAGRVFFCAAFFLVSCLVLTRVMGPSGAGVGAALAQALLSASLVNCILRSRKSSADVKS